MDKNIIVTQESHKIGFNRNDIQMTLEEACAGAKVCADWCGCCKCTDYWRRGCFCCTGCIKYPLDQVDARTISTILKAETAMKNGVIPCARTYD